MYAYCRSVYTRHLRDPYRVDRHWWPGKRAPSAQNVLRITVYSVDLHSKYTPGLRDQESYHTILYISFDTRYLYIAQVSSDWSLIHSIFDISKYRDTTKYRYRTFTSIAILRYIEYRTSGLLIASHYMSKPSYSVMSLSVWSQWLVWYWILRKRRHCAPFLFWLLPLSISALLSCNSNLALRFLCYPILASTYSCSSIGLWMLHAN